LEGFPLLFSNFQFGHQLLDGGLGGSGLFLLFAEGGGCPFRLITQRSCSLFRLLAEIGV
jgi:hypothetical protein